MPDQSSFSVALTLELEAVSESDALLLAADAAMGMQDSQGVQHCSIAVEAEPLFDSQPFAQIRGQLGMSS
jgi:hypothetical protein